MSRAESFTCNGCGAPLPIPKNSKGHVKCPSCKTECVIEGLVKNAEIAAKENIKAGFPLFASPATLHRKLVSVLSDSPCMPLDVFEKGEVVREERHCVPAFQFECNGTMPFNYEVGNERSQTYTVDRGDRVEVREKTRIEWSPSSSSASVSQILFASGNKKHALRIKNLYTFLDHNQLIDIEQWDFPYNMETHNYDLPESAAFTEHVKPIVEDMLRKTANDMLARLNTRNETSGGSSIQKEVSRVFLGLYHVVFKYDDKEYSVWITGDGESACWESIPEDAQRRKFLEDTNRSMEQEVSAIPVPKTTLLKVIGIAGSIIVGIALGFVVLQNLLGIAIGGVVYIVCLVLRLIQSKAYDTQVAGVRAKYQREIDAFIAQAASVVQQFRMQKKALRGIYEEVAGDANAF